MIVELIAEYIWYKTWSHVPDRIIAVFWVVVVVVVGALNLTGVAPRSPEPPACPMSLLRPLRPGDPDGPIRQSLERTIPHAETGEPTECRP